MSEWQPIETAPKDGTVILIADDRSVYAGFWDANWSPEFPWRFLDSDEENAINGWMDGPKGCTHWMPLPKPPEGET